MILGKTDSGKEFKLPIELVTQTVAVLAKRGVGKTYTGSVMAEEMLERDQQIAVLDPTGAWHGLRSSADGKHAGYPVVVFGGEHGDVPLQEHAGEVIATSMVERRFSAIIDLSLFRKGQARRFVTAFLETLYRLNREPLHLFVDEADDIAPQKPMGDEAQMLGAIEDIVKRGRKKGIGCTLITQRPADLAKQVLTQCEMLITLRIVHPRDINAIKEWVNVHADPQEAKDMIASLPSLPIGQGWFWSPGWGDIFDLVAVRKRRTFDSSATPKPGEKARKPSVLATVDIKALGEQIGKTAEEAKANDPRELKRQVADLQRQLVEAAKVKPGKTEIKRVEVPILKEPQVKRLEVVCERLNGALTATVERFVKAAESVQAAAHELSATIGVATKVQSQTVTISAGAVSVPLATVTRPPAVPVKRSNANRDETLGGAPLRILQALAQHPDGLSVRAAGIRSGVSPGLSTWRGAIKKLRDPGYIDDSGDKIKITQAGVAAVGDFDPLPTGPALIEWWCKELPDGASKMLKLLASRYPSAVSRTDLAAAAGCDEGVSTFRGFLAKLRAFELVEDSDDGLVLNGEFA